MRIVFVAAARPNFPKIGPLIRALNGVEGVESLLVHTGQHYDDALSDSFFRTLEIPIPDINLGIGGGSHAENTGRTMIEFEKYIMEKKPDLVVVVGDVNATLACGIVAKKCHIPLAHVEAGLRSFDEKMPEEVNRVIVDRIADYLFVTEKSGITNLKNEGISEDKIFFIGNVMIDSLVFALDKIKKSTILSKLNIEGNYSVLTMHRPSTVDDEGKLSEFLDFILGVSDKIKIVWPIHPRTKNNIEKFGLKEKLIKKNIIMTEALAYDDFMNLVINSNFVMTDSGGIQEETSYMNIPCLTFRDSTERPITVELGTNILISDDYNKANNIIRDIIEGNFSKGQAIPLWDGKAALRFADWIKYKSKDFSKTL